MLDFDLTYVAYRVLLENICKKNCLKICGKNLFTNINLMCTK